jgi:hypothetical protein
VEKCETPLVQNTADEFNRIKEEMTRSSQKSSPGSDSGDMTSDSMPNGDIKAGNNWKWSGTDFVKSSSTEPWVIVDTI